MSYTTNTNTNTTTTPVLSHIPETCDNGQPGVQQVNINQETNTGLYRLTGLYSLRNSIVLDYTIYQYWAIHSILPVIHITQYYQYWAKRLNITCVYFVLVYWFINHCTSTIGLLYTCT